jgi:Thiamine pyrophosphate-requiring enzymes [acetolactate synthase, pyruvate dehydrogenase (cytochrome), glyoxylate carboligase, phosphonopyruvate decarboxylase]
MTTSSERTKMPVVEALQVLIERRQANRLVVTNQGASRLWPKLARHPLDLHYNPSTMGGAVPLALGLALAQPQREVLVVSGDGALLMSLGSLVTVAGSGAVNLTVVVLDNGLYEVTGGQQTPAAKSCVDYVGLARSAGFPSASRFADLVVWREQASAAMTAPGPRLISLEVDRAPPEYLRSATPPLAEQLVNFRRTLRTGDACS